MKTLRILFIILLIAFLSVIMYFIFRPTESSEQPEVLYPGKSLQLKFQYTEMSGKKIKYTATADQYLVDTKGFYHLAGNIRIKIYSSEMEITAQKCTINRAKTRYEFSGSVFLKGKEVEAKTEKAVYFPKRDLVLIRSELEFKKGSIKGNAERGRFDLKEKTSFFISPSFLIGESNLAGRNLQLSENESKGELKGKPAVIAKGEKTAQGPSLNLFIEEQEIKKVIAPKGGKLVLGEKEGYLRAEWYEIDFEKGVQARNAFIVKEDVKIHASNVFIREKDKEIIVSDGVRIEKKGLSIKAFSGRIKDNQMNFKGKVEILRENDRIFAEKAVISEDGKEISLTEAEYISPSLSLKADSIKIKDRDIIAEGNVEGQKEDAALKCERLEKKGDEENLFGNIRILKRGNLIIAQNVKIANGKFIVYQGKIVTGEGYRVKGEELIYTDKNIKINKNVNITGQDLKIVCDRAELEMDGGNLKRIVATKVKSVLLKDTSGEGDRMIYDLEKEIAIFSGKAKLNSPKEGVMKGEMIKFYLKESRFEISGKGRTSSKIKREK